MVWRMWYTGRNKGSIVTVKSKDIWEFIGQRDYINAITQTLAIINEIDEDEIVINKLKFNRFLKTFGKVSIAASKDELLANIDKSAIISRFSGEIKSKKFYGLITEFSKTPPPKRVPDRDRTSALKDIHFNQNDVNAICNRGNSWFDAFEGLVDCAQNLCQMAFMSEYGYSEKAYMGSIDKLHFNRRNWGLSEEKPVDFTAKIISKYDYDNQVYFSMIALHKCKAHLFMVSELTFFLRKKIAK